MDELPVKDPTVEGSSVKGLKGLELVCSFLLCA